MNVMFTCGGTGGHINPAIAVAKLFRERRPETEILFVGADDGMEKNLVPREGFRLETISISNFQRSFSPKALAHNIRAGACVVLSRRKVDRLIRSFRPDVIVGTGGYACYPTIRQGAKAGIPTMIHESNAQPGLTTRMVEKLVDRVLVNYEECRGSYSHPERVVVTGTPVREGFIYTRRDEARRALGIDERPLIVSYWGSLGAREMNKKIAEFIRLETKERRFNHIHATGSFGWKWMPELIKNSGVDLDSFPEIRLQEYIYDMTLVMAAADLVICRAGASTLSELAASGTPALIVPSPNVTANHQESNARVYEARGAAVVVLEKDCDGASLLEISGEILADEQRLRSMREALRGLCVPDSAQKIYEIAVSLTQK